MTDADRAKLLEHSERLRTIASTQESAELAHISHELREIEFRDAQPARIGGHDE